MQQHFHASHLFQKLHSLDALTPPCTACRTTLTCSPSRPRQTLAVALSLIVMGRYLVASWGSHEFLRYTLFVNSTVGFGIFVAQIFYYMTSFKYRYLEVPVSGGMGILAALVVTIKQRLGDVSAAAALALWAPNPPLPSSNARNIFPSASQTIFPPTCRPSLARIKIRNSFRITLIFESLRRQPSRRKAYDDDDDDDDD